MSTSLERSQQTDAILAWQDRWTIAIDDAFLQGWPLLDAVVSQDIAKVGLLDLLGVGAPIDARLSGLVASWKRLVVDPHLRAAGAELGALVPVAPATAVREAPPVLSGDASPARDRAIVAGWLGLAGLLFAATVAATAVFAVVPFMAVLSMLLGFLCGAWTFGMYPGPRLRRRADADWRHRVQRAVLGPGSLRERALRDTVEAAASCIPAGV